MGDVFGRLSALLKELEKGGYNAKPTKLRQGSLHLFHDDGTEATEEEYDRAYAEIEERRKRESEEASKISGR